MLAGEGLTDYSLPSMRLKLS